MGEANPSVLVIDDDPEFRDSVARLLRTVGLHARQFSSVPDFLKADPPDGPTCLVLDVRMPGRSGLDALTQIKQIAPHVPVLIMSMYPEDQYALRVLKAGASGYLGKDNIHDDIIRAIQAVQLGKKFITAAVAEKLADSLGEDKAQQLHESLSDREFEVLKLLAGGKAVSDIASQLSLSATTVSTYRARIMEKMNMRTNAELTRYALEKKLI